MIEELKCCPFCGMVARYRFNGSEGFVQCDVCGARGAKFYLHDEICVKEEAVKFWNVRADSDDGK